MKRFVGKIRAVVLRSPLASQGGQAFMEYILTVIACVIGLRFMSVLFQVAIRHYLKPIYFFISLPFP